MPSETAPLLAPGRTLGVIGAGVMGTTLVKGLLDAGLVTRRQVWATAKTAATCEEVAESLQIETATDYERFLPDAGIVVICVKPAQIGAVAERLKRVREDALLVSILAGVTISRLEGLLGTENPWIRAMPNTPFVVGEGMTTVCGGRTTTPEHLETAKSLFSAVGRCVAVDEGYFNAITAISGSGPAYIYLIIEALADAGVRVGLPRHLALELVAQTMLGATKMVQETGRHPAALRDDVTTPAGCTIGGLLMLEDGKIRSVLARAVEEATRIVGTLGQAPGTPRPSGGEGQG
ncbi:pyrroline-5-carboxylate reductase [soil metagenome]